MDVSVLIRLIDQFSGPAQKVRDSAQGISNTIKDIAGGAKEGFSNALKNSFSVENIEAATKNAENALGRARGRLLGALGQAVAIGAPVIKAAQFDQSMQGLDKVLDVPAERLQALRNFALNTSALIPVAAKDILELMAEAAQGGVPKDELEVFTNYVAQASVAFDMAGKEIGERFAKLRNVYKLNQEGIEDLGDATNHLSNNMAAKAEEVTNFTNRAAGAAGILKMTAVQTAAFGTAMIAAGIVPETAARGITAFATRVLVGGKKIDAAFEAVGISREQLLEDINKDGPTAILEFFEELATKGDAGRAALKDMVGQDYVKDFSKLLENPKLLAQALELVADKQKYAGSATDEATKQAKGAVKQWELLINKLNRGAIVIGSALLPTLLELANQVGSVIDQFAKFSEANPTLIKYLVIAVAALMGLSIASRLLAFAFAGLRVGILPLIGLFLKFNKAGQNIAIGWRLLAGAGRLVGSVFRIAGAGLKGFASGALEAGRAAVAAQGKLRTLSNLARSGMAASWMWKIGFDIIDDFGRTPEERIEQIRKNHEAWQNLEKQVDESWAGGIWQGMKDKANDLMGLERGVSPAEALSAWASSKAAQFNQIGSEWIDALLKGVQASWDTVTTWFSEKIAALKELFSFDMNINWPEPPEWLSWLWGKGKEADKTASSWISSLGIGGSQPALIDGKPATPSYAGGPAKPNTPWYAGGAWNPDKVEQTINAEVIDKRPPNVTVHAPISISGVVDPQAAGRAAAAQLGKAIANAKSGSLHGGTED